MSKFNCAPMDLPPLELVMPTTEVVPSPKTIEDRPPEVLTNVLEFVTFDKEKRNMLACRLVHSQWKEIMDSLIKKRIVSNQFPPFPLINIDGDEDQLHVCFPSTRFPADDGYQFPFHALHLKEDTTSPIFHLKSECSHSPLSLPEFATKFGGNVTTFVLRRQVIPVITLTKMLGSMPNLKRLHLQELREINYPKRRSLSALPIPPPLPRLTILELVLRYPCSKTANNATILYMWLIASYGNQLERLELESGYPLPPLQAPVRNLKELKVSNPSREFLILSDTPALRKICLGSRTSKVILEDVIIFVDKCRSSLEKLILHTLWIEMVSAEVVRKFDNGDRPLFPAVARGVPPVLKTVTIRYPHTDINEIMLSELLVRFPAVEELHLIHFRPHQHDQGIAVEFGNENSQNANEIGALKEQLASILNRMIGKRNNRWLVEGALARLRKLGPEDAQNAAVQAQQLKAEMGGLQNDLISAQMERVAIFNRLAALGENTKKLMVQQMLLRGGIWNVSPRLRTVRVSSADLSTGDVCVVRRTDGDEA